MSTQTKNTFNKTKIDVQSEKTGSRTFNIKISLTTIITVSVLFLICFGWSFVLGVMVGRDYDPETVIPQFSGLSTETTNEQIKALGDDADNAIQSDIVQSAGTENAQAKQSKNAIPLVRTEEDKIIKIEELNFSSSLKGKPGEGKLAIAPSSKDTSKSANKAVNNQAMNNAENMSNSTIPTSSMKMPQQIVNRQETQPEPEQSIYDFVIQVATFKDVDAVDKVRAELEGHDLRTRMSKWKGEKSTFYSVFVVFRGTEAKAQDLNKIFKKLRLGQAIPKEKKLVKK